MKLVILILLAGGIGRVGGTRIWTSLNSRGLYLLSRGVISGDRLW